jgi:hypothetical protein
VGRLLVDFEAKTRAVRVRPERAHRNRTAIMQDHPCPRIWPAGFVTLSVACVLDEWLPFAM